MRGLSSFLKYFLPGKTYFVLRAVDDKVNVFDL